MSVCEKNWRFIKTNLILQLENKSDCNWMRSARECCSKIEKFKASASVLLSSLFCRQSMTFRGRGPNTECFLLRPKATPRSYCCYLVGRRCLPWSACLRSLLPPARSQVGQGWWSSPAGSTFSHLSSLSSPLFQSVPFPTEHVTSSAHTSERNVDSLLWQIQCHFGNKSNLGPMTNQDMLPVRRC